MATLLNKRLFYFCNCKTNTQNISFCNRVDNRNFWKRKHVDHVGFLSLSVYCSYASLVSKAASAFTSHPIHTKPQFVLHTYILYKMQGINNEIKNSKGKKLQQEQLQTTTKTHGMKVHTYVQCILP